MYPSMQAEELHQRFLKALDNLSTLKIDRKLYSLIAEWGETMLALIAEVEAGKTEKVSVGKSHLRAMEALYHSAPQQLKLSPSKVRQISPGSPKSEFEQLLEALRPPTGWNKWRNLLIEKVLFVVLGGVGTFLVVRYLLHG